MSQLTSQRLYTLLRPISHVASSPRHLSHSSNLHFHIYHHSLVRFACLSAKDCGTPRTVTLRSLRSRRSHTRRTAFGFCVLLLCTALIRRLSAYQRTSWRRMKRMGCQCHDQMGNLKSIDQVQVHPGVDEGSSLNNFK